MITSPRWRSPALPSSSRVPGSQVGPEPADSSGTTGPDGNVLPLGDPFGGSSRVQTPRGFLIGAGAIAAIAAFASVGHPRSETNVRMSRPASQVEQTPTVNASNADPDTGDSDIEVLPK